MICPHTAHRGAAHRACCSRRRGRYPGISLLVAALVTGETTGVGASHRSRPTEGPLVEAPGAAFLRGDALGALGALGHEGRRGEDPETRSPLRAAAERLLQSRALYALGRVVEALAVLDSAPALLDGPLGPHLRAWRATLQARLGFHREAAKEWAVVSRAPILCLADRARMERAEQLLLAGRWAEAARAFDGLRRLFPDHPSPSRWLNGEAASRLLAGDRARAASLFRRLLLLDPASPEADGAARTLETLRRDGISAPPYSTDEALGRLRRLAEVGRIEQALQGLRSLREGGRVDQDRANLAEARMLLANHRYGEAARILGPLAQTGGPGPRRAARALLPKALARARSASPVASSPSPRPGSGSQAARSHEPRPPSPGARAAMRPRAALQALLEAGKYADAERLASRRTPGPTLFGAYLALRAGHAAKAAAQLRLLAVDGRSGRGARYWLALATRAQGRDGEARSQLAALAEELPIDWYGLLARARLVGHGEEPSPRPMATRVRVPDWKGLVRSLEAHAARWPALGRVAALVGAGLAREALTELGELARLYLLARPGERRAQTLRPLCAQEAWRGVRHRAEPRRLDRAPRRAGRSGRVPGRAAGPGLGPPGAGGGPGDQTLEATLYRALVALGDPYLAGRFARRASGRPIPRLATPFSQMLRTEAKAASLPPGRLWAVMTVESAYCPNVVSSAGAMGLLQIMPRTGARLAEHLGEGSFHLDELFEPRKNLRFGAYYLARLLERFGGQLSLAVAAYNAGPHNVDRWVTHRAAGIELDGLVEEIPFRETRAYVKRVVGLTARYAVELGEPLVDLVRLRVEPSTLNNIDF